MVRQPGHQTVPQGRLEAARLLRPALARHPQGRSPGHYVCGTGAAVSVNQESRMARITYDDQTAAAYKAVREVPRDGLGEWRDAIRRHLSPLPGMTLVDIGAGTGQFAAAFSDWFGLTVLAVEPSAAMRQQISWTPAIQVLE